MNEKRHRSLTPPKSEAVPSSPPNEQPANESRADLLARAALRPPVQAALTLMEYNKPVCDLSFAELVGQLGAQCEQASRGNLKQAEELLAAQAQTLDAIFNNLARRAMRAELVSQFDTHLRLAFKAQAQCRSTLDTLAAIKNPQPVAFVQQANIAHGPQQINNAPPGMVAGPSGNPRAGDMEKPQSQLLGDRDG